MSPHCLRIGLLGGFSISHDGQPISLPTRKAAAVLAVLALSPGQAVARERLADLLWPGSAAEQARGSLRQALSQLRRTLDNDGRGLIESTAHTVVLDRTRVSVDAVELTEALAAGDPTALEVAARVYSGGLLAGFSSGETPFDDWAQAEATRLQRLALDGLGRLLDHHVAHADMDAAQALAERLIHIDPTHEHTYQAMMRLYLRNGALGATAREYERCKSALATHLGVPPSATTEALRRTIWTASSGAAGDADNTPVVAILPFSNLSGVADDELMVRGFSADLVHELSRFRALRVVAAHSSFTAASMASSAGEAGRHLGARYLVTGSVRRGPGHLRIAAEVVDSANGLCLWSHRDDVGAETLFDVQNDIARGVASALAVRIDNDRLQRAVRKPLESLETYDCWLRGLACLRQGTAESHEDARRYFHLALDKDPEFARAYSGLSLTHFNEWSCIAWNRWDENECKAFEHAQRGLALDDDDHMTHFVLGRILLYRREYERAIRHLDRAEALNPNDADMLAQLALSDALLGEPLRGMDRARLAMRLNPYHDDWYFLFAAAAAMFSRHLEEAITLGLKAPHVATDAHAWVGAAYAHLDNPHEAQRHLAAFHQVFRRKITYGREPAADEPARWIAHVNPLRRPGDLAFLLDGLAKAGLPVPDDLHPAPG